MKLANIQIQKNNMTFFRHIMPLKDIKKIVTNKIIKKYEPLIMQKKLKAKV